MSNCYQVVAARDSIPCSQELWLDLQELLDKVASESFETVDYEDHGLTFTWNSGFLYAFAEDWGNLDALPQSVLEKIAGILGCTDLDYWQFGVAYYSDKLRPDSCGGFDVRITKDGTIQHTRPEIFAGPKSDMKYWLCSIEERYGEYEATDYFLIRCPEALCDRAVAEVTAGWRGARYEEMDELWWFDGNAHHGGELLSEVPDDEAGILKRYRYHVLWEHSGVDLPDRVFCLGGDYDGEAHEGEVTYMFNGEILTAEFHLEGNFDMRTNNVVFDGGMVIARDNPCYAELVTKMKEEFDL